MPDGDVETYSFALLSCGTNVAFQRGFMHGEQTMK